MKRIVAACFPVILAPGTVAFTADTEAIVGKAIGGGSNGATAGTTVMTVDDEIESRRGTRMNRVEPASQREMVFMEALPPPPRIIQLEESPYESTPPGEAKYRNQHVFEYE